MLKWIKGCKNSYSVSPSDGLSTYTQIGNLLFELESIMGGFLL